MISFSTCFAKVCLIDNINSLYFEKLKKKRNINMTGECTDICVQYLSSFHWVISLNRMTSSFIYVVACFRITFLFKAGMIFHYFYAIISLFIQSMDICVVFHLPALL